jgi:hypothetical protein
LTDLAFYAIMARLLGQERFVDQAVAVVQQNRPFFR